MKNKIALSVALALAMVSENKAMVAENKKKEGPVICLSKLLNPTELPNYSKLKALKLINFALTAQSIETLIKNLHQSLTHLDLRCNQIGADGASVLAKYLPRDLIYLNLASNEIGDEAVSSVSSKAST
jgi:Ran GTPase-activating protein (RanGAP) involved in mRNA processing and transport